MVIDRIYDAKNVEKLIDTKNNPKNRPFLDLNKIKELPIPKN